MLHQGNFDGASWVFVLLLPLASWFVQKETNRTPRLPERESTREPDSLLDGTLSRDCVVSVNARGKQIKHVGVILEKHGGQPSKIPIFCEIPQEIRQRPSIAKGLG